MVPEALKTSKDQNENVVILHSQNGTRIADTPVVAPIASTSSAEPSKRKILFDEICPPVKHLKSAEDRGIDPIVLDDHHDRNKQGKRKDSKLSYRSK